MEPSDWLEFAQGAMSNAAAFFAIFWTLVSGYLFIAYSIGEKLLKAHVIFINLLFLVSTSMSTLASLVASTNGLLAIRQAETTIGEVTALSANQANTVLIISAVVNLAVVLGCLKFMWDMRHPKDQ
jgi:hypothetical protein